MFFFPLFFLAAADLSAQTNYPVHIRLIGVSRVKAFPSLNEKTVKEQIYNLYSLCKQKSKVPEIRISFSEGLFASRRSISSSLALPSDSVSLVYIKSYLTNTEHGPAYFTYDTSASCDNLFLLSDLHSSNIFTMFILEAINPFIPEIKTENSRLLNHSIIILKNSTDGEGPGFYTLLSNFFEYREGLDAETGKNYFSFSDLFSYFRPQAVYYINADSPAPFISYAWHPPIAQTNYVLTDIFTNETIKGSTSFYQKNFVVYRREIPDRTERKKIGSERVEQITEIPGKWE